MESFRQQKVAKVIQKELGDIFQKQGRSLNNAIITVTSVSITRDFSMARVHLSIFATGDKNKIFELIKENSSMFRYELGNRMRQQLRTIPTLEFFFDDTLDYNERIDELLKK